jgi:hypothetical protein
LEYLTFPAIPQYPDNIEGVRRVPLHSSAEIVLDARNKTPIDISLHFRSVGSTIVLGGAEKKMKVLNRSSLILVTCVAIIGFSTSFYVQGQSGAPQSPLWDEIIQSFNNYSGLPTAGLTIGRRDVGVVLNITKGV